MTNAAKAWTASRPRWESGPSGPQLPMIKPAAIVANTPEKWNCSASRNDPYAATVVKASSTKWSSVRLVRKRARPPTAAPHKRAPPTVASNVFVRPTNREGMSCRKEYGHSKGDRRRAVVEQTLGFNQQSQPSMNSGFTKSRNYRHRVRRRNQGAEYDCTRPLPTSQVMHSQRCEGSRNDHSGACQSEYHWKFPTQLAAAKVKCCLEDQGRQERVKNQVLRELNLRGQRQ